MGCFYHSKVEATGACRRCMIPICEECTRERYCPECHKMAMYMRQGQSSQRQPNLVAMDQERRASVTRQLMINRLAGVVLAETRAEEPPAARKRAAAAPRRAVAKKRAKPVAPIAASVLALIAAFSLGTFFSRPPAQAVVAPAVAEAADPASAEAEMVGDSAEQPAAYEAEAEAAGPAARPEVSYAEVPANRLIAQDVAMPRREPHHAAGAVHHAAVVPSLPQAPRSHVGPNGRAALQALAAQGQPAVHAPEEEALVPDLPAAPAAGAHHADAAPAGNGAATIARADVHPTVAMSWPVAGNTLRMTSYVKVRVTNPGQVSVLNVTVDGKPFAPVQAVSGRTEIPVDTTRIPNGDHRIQVMAMTESGDIITSEAVPVTVLN